MSSGSKIMKIKLWISMKEEKQIRKNKWKQLAYYDGIAKLGVRVVSKLEGILDKHQQQAASTMSSIYLENVPNLDICILI